VRADYLDTVVWQHITELIADPQLIRAEIDKRLVTARTADPTAQQRNRLQTALAKASSGIARMIEAFGEQLITIDVLRARMPDLRGREANLRNQIEALNNQLADREAYLALASDLEGFLTTLARQRRDLHCRRPPPRPAAARQRRPHRTQEDHHPAPHPAPRAHHR
jgi:site-specific DNA recombinase